MIEDLKFRFPESLTKDENIELLSEWGINTIRLGFMWSGAEPEEGQFNMTYFEIMGNMVDKLSAHGISTLLDVHQDGLSEYFCLYDGAPKWVVEKSREPEHAFPWPLQWDGQNPCPYDRSWAKNYLAEATGVAFDGLYNNFNGMRDAFENFISFTASYFKGKDILGYEILNEPWPGDIYSDPRYLCRGQPHFDSTA